MTTKSNNDEITIARKLDLNYDDDGVELNVGDKVRIHGEIAVIAEEDGKRILIGFPDDVLFDGIEKV